jgi:hypothetical protein
MKNYLRAGLVAGIACAVLGPVFVHFVLSAELAAELRRVLASAAGSAHAEGGGIGQFTLHAVVRVAFGFLTMAAFAVLQRKRSRLRAAWTAGLAFWLLGYVLWPLYLLAVHGLSWTLLAVSIGYGFCETQVAAHAGGLAWGRKTAAEPRSQP